MKRRNILKALFLVFGHFIYPLVGTYTHQAAGIALHPHEWRSAKQQRTTTPPPGRRKNYPFSDGGFSEDDWDKPPG